MHQHTLTYININNIHQHTSRYIDIHQHTSTYIDIHRHTSTIHQHTSTYSNIHQHSATYINIHQHTSTIHQHTSTYSNIHQHSATYINICQIKISTYINIQKHTSTYINVHQHTATYTNIHQHTMDDTLHIGWTDLQERFVVDLSLLLPPSRGQKRALCWSQWNDNESPPESTSASQNATSVDFKFETKHY